MKILGAIVCSVNSVQDTIEDHILATESTCLRWSSPRSSRYYLGEEREFEEIVMEICLGSNDEHETRSRFEALGQNLVQAQSSHLREIGGR